MIKYLTFTFVFLVCIFTAEVALLSIEVNETDHAFDYFEQTGPVETLIIGQCEAATNIAPAYLGNNVFNFSMYDFNFYYQRKLLERILIKNQLKSVILTINPLMLMGRYRMPLHVQRYLWFTKGFTPDNRDLSDTILSFGNHSHLWNEQIKQLIFKDDSSDINRVEYASASSTVPLQQISEETYYQDGFRGMTRSYNLNDTGRMLDELMNNFDFTDKKSELDELISMLTLLKDASVKTTILLLPEVSGFRELMEKRMPGTEERLQETLGSLKTHFPDVRIHDFRSNHDIPDNLFAEANHLTVKGADLFGVELKKILSDEKSSDH